MPGVVEAFLSSLRESFCLPRRAHSLDIAWTREWYVTPYGSEMKRSLAPYVWIGRLQQQVVHHAIVPFSSGQMQRALLVTIQQIRICFQTA